MNILGLTTTAAVRALIGIDEASGELPDSLFTDHEISDGLRLELATWLPVSLATVIAGGDGTGDDGDLAYISLRQAAKAWCAVTLLQAGEISLAQRHEDGQNKFARQTFDMQAVLERLGGLYARYRELCLLYLGQTVVASTSWLVGSSVPAYDPVTDATTS
jgi:hypothetical protein